MTSVVWITGLSGAGKSTLARELVRVLRDEGRAVVMLDGDDLREVLALGTMDSSRYSRDQRVELALRYSRLCRYLAEQGFIVVIATISMFAEVHSWNRSNLPGYIEVYIRVPIDELRKRDPKGIYRRFDSGEISNVAGLDLQIDEPQSPDVLYEPSSGDSVLTMATKLFELLVKER
jgi:adenylylsulfate kinase